MAKVKVTHKQKLTSDEAAKPPARELPDPGQYLSGIKGTNLGIVKGSAPPIRKLTVEFELKHQVLDDARTDEKWKGKRVWQDYILEDDPSQPALNPQRLYELRMLLDATETAYDDDGFDPDDLKAKECMIWIKVKQASQKQGQKIEDVPFFTNVHKVDTAKKIDADSLL